MELGHDHVLVHPLGFIHCNADGYATRDCVFAQAFADDLVLRCQPLTSVDDKNNRFCFGNGLQSLLGHFMHDAFSDLGLEASGIHHQVGTAGTTAVAVVSITGQTGHICHDRITCFSETVEQHGFADVWSTNNDDCRFHICTPPRSRGNAISR